jgi:hypothetical protein
MSPAATKRHNEAGSLCVRAICEGERGDEVLMSDVGLQKRQQQRGLQRGHAARIPVNKILEDAPLGRHQELAQILQRSRPDALLRSQPPGGGSPHYPIVELKYCSDTDSSQQRQRAEAQHQDLAACLRTIGTVSQVTLTLGVSGGIYKEFHEQMESLGVRGPRLKALARKLHMNAVMHLDKIWRARQAAIKTKGKCVKAGWSRQKRAKAGQPDHRKRVKRRKC